MAQSIVFKPTLEPFQLRSIRAFNEVVNNPLICQKLSFLNYKRTVELQVEVSPILNAKAFELKNKPSIAITTACEVLSEDELKALIAHEVSHIIHRDYEPSGIGPSAICGAFTIAIIFLSIKISLLLFTFLIALPFLYIYLQQAHSQYIELRADRLAAQIVGKKAIISLLNRLQPQDVPVSFFNKVERAFKTHPSIQFRIAHIKELK